MKQTALQELLQWVRATLPMDLDTPRMIEEKIESLLRMEKEQIEDAYDQMRCVGNYENGKQYYNETYETKTIK
jgi:hypothetical protein